MASADKSVVVISGLVLNFAPALVRDFDLPDLNPSVGIQVADIPTMGIIVSQSGERGRVNIVFNNGGSDVTVAGLPEGRVVDAPLKGAKKVLNVTGGANLKVQLGEQTLSLAVTSL